MTHLPTLTLSLPHWKESDFREFAQGIEQLGEISVDSGQTSDRFVEACDSLLSIALSGDSSRIQAAIRSNIDVRAATFLLSTHRGFVDAGVLCREFLDSLLKPRETLSRLSLLHLVRSFVVHFDKIGDEAALLALSSFIREQLAAHLHPHNTDALALNAKYRDLIFALDGPANVVKYAVSQGKSLEKQLDSFALTGYGKGRFQRLCSYRFYIQTLKEIPVGDNHKVLKDLAEPAVFMAPGSDGGTLGHEVLKILIDRSTVEASEVWRNLILTIAGDPRVPVKHPRFQQWWALLGEGRIEKVTGWLSRFDLSLFLEALEDYGNSSDDQPLKRMFPARKRFLEGLVEQGAVVTSRLFVGRKAHDYLSRNYERSVLPAYATLRDANLSMIYLRVGHCHMVEGSHNCRLRIFPRLPSTSTITDYGVKQFEPYDLKTRAQRQYQEEFGIDPRPASIPHNPRAFRWQHDAINYLAKQGIRLDTEKLFSRADYRDYRAAHGVQIWVG